jgi:ABC-type glycerol-3-phosphate transport system substrate-binding protein
LSWPGWTDLETKLIAATVGGSMPQLFRMGASFVPNAADSGLALALDDRVKQWGQRKDFFDGSWETVAGQGVGHPTVDREPHVGLPPGPGKRTGRQDPGRTVSGVLLEQRVDLALHRFGGVLD